MDCDQSEITRALLASYREIGGINHLDGVNLPSKAAVAAICHDLLKVLFPGYYESHPLTEETIFGVTQGRVGSLVARLEVEVARSLAFRTQCPKNAAAEAHELTCGFLRRLPEVRALLRTDMEAAFHGDPAAECREEVILAYPGLEAIAIQRSAHLLYQSGVPLIPRMMTEWAHSRTGIDIHPGARIGSHFFIDHGTGVVIGETSIIGSHVKLYQGVGLVARSLSAGQKLRGRKRHPSVEDGVTIYANATVVGDVTVGANSTIGANVFITDSVPPDSLVALGEQKNDIRRKERQPAVVP